MPCYTVNPSKLPHMCIARFPLSTNIAMEHPPCWWYLPVKKRLSWAMFVSGKVIQWPLFKIIKETSSQRSTIHLAHCPSLDITLHFTLEVVHELMQQQQTSSRQVRHILPFPTAKPWNIHPFHTYVTLRFKISMAQIEMFKRNCKQESSNGQNTTPRWTWQFLIPLFGQNMSEYFSVLFRIHGSRYCPSTKSSLGVFVASVVSSWYSSKWINWRIPKRPWDSGFDRKTSSRHEETLHWNQYRSYTTTTRLNKRKGTIQAPLHFRWCLVFQ